MISNKLMQHFWKNVSLSRHTNMSYEGECDYG